MQMTTYLSKLSLFLLGILLAVSTSAQEVFFIENFTNTSAWQSISRINVPSPSNWVNTATGPQGQFATSPISSNEAQNRWVMFDSDDQCNHPNGQDTWLISPAIDGSGRTNITLEFKTFYRSYNDRPQIRVGTSFELNNLDSWATYEVFPGVQATQYGDGNSDETPLNNPQTITIDISDIVDGAPEFYIAYQFLSIQGVTDNNGNLWGCAYSWQVDDMKLTSFAPPTFDYTDISCGMTIDSSTVGAENNYFTFPQCGNIILDGPDGGDHIYRLEIEEAQTVFISLDPGIGGQLAYLTENDPGNQPGDCITYVFSDLFSHITINLDPGVYWIVVDGLEGDYELSVDCNNRQIECGSTLISPTDGINFRQSYAGCTNSPMAGKDALYWFELTEDATVDIEVRPTSPFWFPKLFLLSNSTSNQPGECITFNSEFDPDIINSRIIENLPPGKYWIAIDVESSFEGYTESFELSFNCYPGENNGAISCGDDFLIGTTKGTFSNFDGSQGVNCWGGGLNGGDRLYSFLITQPQSVVFNVSSIGENNSFYCSIYNPGTGTCIDIGINQVSAFLGPGNYILIIDNETVDDEGPFLLTMNCYPDDGLSQITCGTTTIGDSNGNFSSNTSFADACSDGSPWDFFPSRDRIYQLIVPQTTDIIISVESFSEAYLTVLLTENNGNQPGVCIARGQNFEQYSEITEYLQAGIYWVIIDGIYTPPTIPETINQGPFELTVNCVDNYEGITMSCGDVFTASTIDYISNFDGADYEDCIGSLEAYPSADRSFVFDIEGEEKNVSLYLDNLTQKDLDLFLFSVDKQGNLECLGSSTQSAGKDEAIIINLNVGRYIAAVDGKGEEESIFELSLNCFDMPSVCDLESTLIDAGNLVTVQPFIGFDDPTFFLSYIPPAHIQYLDCITDIYGDNNLPRKGMVYTYYHDAPQNFFDLELNAEDPTINVFVFGCSAPSTTDRSDLCLATISINSMATIPAQQGNFYYILVADQNESPFDLKINSPGGPCSEDNQLFIGDESIEPCTGYDPNNFENNPSPPFFSAPYCYSFEGQGNNYNSEDYIACLNPSDDLFTRNYDGEDMVFVIDLYSSQTTLPNTVAGGFNIRVETTGAAGLFLYNYECGETCIDYVEIPDGGGIGDISLEIVFDAPDDDESGLYYLIVDQEDTNEDIFYITAIPTLNSPPCPFDAVMDLRFVEGSVPGLSPDTELFVDFDRDDPFFDSVFHFVPFPISWDDQAPNTPRNTTLEGYSGSSNIDGEIWLKCGHDAGDSLVFRGILDDGSVKILQGEFVDTTNNPALTALGRFTPDAVSLVRKLRVVGSEPAPALGVVPNVLESRKATAAKSLQDTFDITVTANKRWRIIEGNNNGWYSFSPDRDDDPPYDQVVRFIAEENLSSDTRSDTLILASLDTLEQIIIVQEPSPCFFNPLDPPELQATATMLCVGETITINTNGSYVAYNWSNGETSEMIEITEPGEYWVEVNGTDGCSSRDTITIEAFPEPSVSIAGELNICPDSETELSAGNFQSYLWSTNQNSSSIAVNEADEYWVEVTDNNGCKARDTVNTQFYPEVGLEITGDLSFCFNTNTTLNAGAYQSYDWSTGESSPSITVDIPGPYSVEVTDANGCMEMTEVVVEELAEVEVEISGDLSFCFEENTTLTAGDFESYDWSTGESDPMIVVDVPNTYSVEVTDINGCIGTDEVIVEEFPEVQVAITGDLSFCFGESTNLSAGDFESYMWSNGEAGPSINVGMPSIISVEVTDQNGCNGTDQVTVEELPELQVEITGDTDPCFATSTTLSVDGFETYSWSTGETSNAITVSESDTYAVDVMDINGCTATDEIIINFLPEVLPEITGLTSFCPNESTTLSVSGYESYLWSTNEETPSINVNQPGDYTVEVTDINGCVGTDMVTVTENDNVVFEIMGALSFCENGNTTLDAGDFETYLWSTNEETPTITVDQPGTYSVVVTNSNGCQGEQSVEVTEFNEVPVEITGVEEFCFGESTELSAGDFETYLWSTDAESPTIEVTIPGNYTVEVTDANGCTGTDNIEITELPPLIAEISGEENICVNTNTELTVGDYESYLWSTDEETPSISVDQAGTYSVEVTDANGCTATDEIEINFFPEIQAEITGEQSFCFGENTELSAGDFESYLWSTDEETPSIIVEESANISVVVTDANGCSAETQVVITEFEEVIAEISGQQSFCFGESTELSAGDFESYLWSTDEETPSIVVEETGNVSVIVTDANGCPGEAQIDITEFEEVITEISGEQSFCFGENTELSAGDFESYLWSTDEETPSIVVEETGNVSVIVTDANGCPGEAQIDITEFDEVITEITGEQSFCFGESTELSAGDFESYLWSTDEETPTIIIEESANISVVVTDANGCPGEAQIDITEFDEVITEISGEQSFCFGGSSELSAGNFETYLWSTDEETPSIVVEETGSVSVIVTDANGCPGEAQINITEFDEVQIQISGSLSFCPGTSTTLDAGDFESYLWSTDEETPSIIVDQPGEYTVEVIDINGCEASTTVMVEENEFLQPQIMGELGFCPDGNTTLSAGNFETYLWSTDEETASIIVDQPGEYTVEVTDINGCEGMNTVNVTEFDAVEFEITGEATFCFDESTQLDAGSFESYLWSTDEETPSITVEESGFYSVQVTDQNGCEGMAEIQIQEFEAVQVDITGETSFCFDENTQLDAGNFESYLWSTDEETPSITVEESGTYTVAVTDQNGCPGMAEIQVQEFEAVQVDITGETTFCFDGSTQLDAGDFETYLWSTDEETPNITVDETGTYSVQVTDQNGCPGMEEVNVQEFEEVQVNINGETSFCFDQNTELDAGDFESYLWSTNEETPNIIVDETGFYSVEVMDENGCSGIAEVNVQEFEEVQVNISGETSFCFGESTQLNAGDFETYLWSTNEESQSITVEETGTFSVEVTDANGCAAMNEIMVEEFEEIQAEIMGNTQFCSGSSTMLDAGDFESYLWSTGEETQSITVSNPDTYSVEVTDINGCAKTLEITVEEFEEIPVSITGDLTFCFDETTQLSAGDYQSYLWSTGEETSTITVEEPGIYSVAVIDENGCPGMGEIMVEELEQVQVNITGETTFCFDGNTQLDAGDFETYLWSTDEETPSITVEETGIYTVEVTDANGCSAMNEIMVEELEQVQVNITGETTFCFDESTQLNAGDFESYLWSTNEETPSIIVEETGTYTVIVTDINGCTETNEIEVNELAPVQINIMGDASFCYEDSTSLDAGIYESYLWSTGEETQSIIVNEAGTYSVAVMDNNGCSGEEEILITELDSVAVAIQGDAFFCVDGNTTLSIEDSFESILWSTGSTLSSITIGIQGNYSVAVVDQEGCIGTSTLFVDRLPEVLPQIEGLLAICEDGTTELSTGEFETYLWSTGEETQSITVSEAGEYSLVVTDEFGCTGETSVFVEDNPGIEVTIEGDDFICPNEETILDAGAFESYFWSTGEVSRMIAVTSPGTYSVEVTDENGCTGNESIEITAAPGVDLDFVDLSHVSCFGEMDGFIDIEVSGGTGDIIVEWQDIGEQEDVNNLGPGNYFVIATDENRCTASATISINEPDSLEINFETMGVSSSVASDGVATAIPDGGTPSYSYEWSTGAMTQSIVGVPQGIYEVTVTDLRGCQTIDTVEIGLSTSAYEVALIQDNLMVFPNPTSSKLYLRYQAEIDETINYDLLDLFGRKMNSGQIEKRNTNYSIDVEDLPKAIYFIRFTVGNISFGQKVIIN